MTANNELVTVEQCYRLANMIANSI